MVYKKVVEYCNENGISISAFEKKCGLGNATVSGWKDGGFPAVSTLQKMEIATGIPMIEWLKNEEV